MRCLPVASKTMHSGVITALAVSVEGSILFSGCSKGEVSIQKIGVPDPADDRTRRNSPFRSPLGFFSLHEGKVLCSLLSIIQPRILDQQFHKDGSGRTHYIDLIFVLWMGDR